MNAVAIAPDGALLVGYGYTATATSAAVTTVTNPGSAAAYPVLTIAGPGRVYQLVNWTAREAIYFNLVLLSGETLTLDLRPQHKTVTSSFRGNVLNAVVPGSALASWRLLPGDNLISLFVDDASASATLTWQERHWSVEDLR
jgi:phage-related protein